MKGAAGVSGRAGPRGKQVGGFLTPQILSIALKLFPVSVELKGPLSCGEKLRCDCVAVSINNETFPDVCNRVLKRRKASGGHEVLFQEAVLHIMF